MPNFGDLLQKPLDGVSRPKALPNGTFLGMTKAYQLLESREKKTPYVEYELGVTAPGDGVDPEAMQGVATSKSLKKQFYLTQDSLYRIKEFIESLHIDTRGRTLQELLPQTVNQPVIMDVIQKPSRNGDGSFFNEVNNIKGQ